MRESEREQEVVKSMLARSKKNKTVDAFIARSLASLASGQM